MKGMVFTEFLDMVEERYSPELVERIIAASELPSKGAYTSIGTYDHQELARLVTELGRAVEVPVPTLLHVFGHHLFGRFHAGFPNFFAHKTDALDFLESLEGVVHFEVKKLYPDSELPRFEISRPSQDELVMVYRSSRGLAEFAAGLIAGCIEHFGNVVDCQQDDLSDGSGTHVRFRLVRRAS